MSYSVGQFEDALNLCKSLETYRNYPDVEGSGLLETQPNDSRAAIRVFFRSVSKYFTGRNTWNMSLHWNFSTSAEPYDLKSMGSRWGNLLFPIINIDKVFANIEVFSHVRFYIKRLAFSVAGENKY